MDKVFEEDYVVFDLKGENKTSDVNSFKMVHGDSKIFEMIYVNDI